MSTDTNNTELESIVPSNAPTRPDNDLLYEFAWKPMWIEDANAVWVVVGDPGDGKSLASIRLGEKIHPDFSIKMVASNILEFMELVMDDSMGQGTPIVLEEASVEASSYDWYSESNAVFRTVLETWRTQNRMAIINLPSFKTLDKGARRRTQFIVEMEEAKPWKDYSVAKPKLVNFNNIDDYFTTPHPVIGNTKHKRMRFSLPSEGLREEYELLKADYQDELNQDMYERLLDMFDDDEDGKELGPKDVADEIIESDCVDDYIMDNHGQKYIDRDMLEMDYGISQNKSKKVKKLLKQSIGVEVL